MQANIMIRSLNEQTLFISGDTLPSLEVATRGSGLDLGNDECEAPLGNDVYLFMPIPPITLMDCIAEGLKVTTG
jgi:hypothetical protein